MTPYKTWGTHFLGLSEGLLRRPSDVDFSVSLSSPFKTPFFAEIRMDDIKEEAANLKSENEALQVQLAELDDEN